MKRSETMKRSLLLFFTIGRNDLVGPHEEERKREERKRKKEKGKGPARDAPTLPNNVGHARCAVCHEGLGGYGLGSCRFRRRRQPRRGLCVRRWPARAPGEARLTPPHDCRLCALWLHHLRRRPADRPHGFECDVGSEHSDTAADHCGRPAQRCLAAPIAAIAA